MPIAAPIVPETTSDARSSGPRAAASPGAARPSAAAETLALPRWQAAVRDAVRTPEELAALLDLPLAVLGAPADKPQFPLLVPRGFVARMQKGDPHDPLLRQVWPAAREHEATAGFEPDPLRERGIAAHGVLKKYARRALLIASGACPIHCRYCFRREFPYREQLAARGDWGAALAELARIRGVDEVILSGGDPLSLGNHRLRDLLDKLEAAGVATARIHSRFPVVVPERIDAGLIETLAATSLNTVIVIHCNHANELGSTAAEALARLRPHVTALLNQSVLLRGVNDDVETLAALSERLFACGVLPYYLHLLDRVSGAAHFEVAAATGVELVEGLRARLAGYLVPRLVKEIPDGLSKTPIY